MNRHLHTILTCALLAGAALLAGCAGGKGSRPNILFDFGAAGAPAPGARAAHGGDPAPPLSALVVSDATGSAALDSERMFYRLDYADALQARTYANSRWSATPLQMVTQRLKARIAQAGVKVLSVTDAAAGVPILRVEIDDFVHAFDSATSSSGQLVLRASVFNGHDLVDQKTFTRTTPAPTPDAAGGAHALAASTDAAAADIVAWLATLKPQPR